MKTIYLKNNIKAVKNECLNRNQPGHNYGTELIDKAIQAQIKNNLRYRNGQTLDRRFGVAAEYCNKSDIPKYKNDGEAAKWEFSGHVRNSASRLSRGLTAI